MCALSCSVKSQERKSTWATFSYTTTIIILLIQLHPLQKLSVSTWMTVLSQLVIGMKTQQQDFFLLPPSAIFTSFSLPNSYWFLLYGLLFVFCVKSFTLMLPSSPFSFYFCHVTPCMAYSHLERIRSNLSICSCWLCVVVSQSALYTPLFPILSPNISYHQLSLNKEKEKKVNTYLPCFTALC